MNNIQKKVGQLLVVGFDGTEVTEHIKHMIHTYHIGSVILFARNVDTPQQVLKLTHDLQHEAKKAGYERPLLICLDQENGVVRRIGTGTTLLPGAMTIGATHDTINAFEIGKLTGKELKALGINWNLAPTVDVNNNPNNPVIGVRSFGDHAETVAQFGIQAMKGMQSEGIATTFKHFPGHGDTAVDSHFAVPVIKRSLEQLKENELIPFEAGIQNDVDTILIAHVAFPQLTNSETPATLSHEIVTDILRKQMNYEGVVTTDCMEMDAIAKGIGTAKAAPQVLQAGIDYVMISHKKKVQEDAIKEIIQAVQNGELPEERINQSINRINKLKDKYTNWQAFDFDAEPKVPTFVGSKEHIEKANDIYRQGITIVQTNDTLPLDKSKNVLVISPQSGGAMAVEDKEYANYNLGDIVKKHIKQTTVIEATNDMDEEQIQTIISEAKKYDTVIIGTMSLSKTSKQITLIENLVNEKVNVIVIAMRNPYDITYLPKNLTCINTYEFSVPVLDLAIQTIIGETEVSGKLPVQLPQN